jgi:hypothetical protein
MNATGYTTLRKDQLFLLYGPHSPYNNTEALQRLSKINETEMHNYIEEDVHKISQLDKFNVRQKDIVLSPISFTFLTLVPALASQPLILSPVIFSKFFCADDVLNEITCRSVDFVAVYLWSCKSLVMFMI